MKDEIKEILERLDKGIKETKFFRSPYFSEDKKYKEVGICLQEEQCNIFKDTLDYITNLQEKVNQYENPDDMTLFYMWLDEKAKDKIKKLQEENKELLKKSYSDDVIITKATEWVKKNMYYFPRPDELLNILNGDDNE